ncbi:DUF4192 domain-containing protein [Nocardioides zeae]|uniref:DUF4192 domain-containing protein n=1 Tax=Nocardioides imazamoxiresistens TaxID=3231893 RepID=A0ABU3PZJ5_9ACTN|nr:DUF4192 domain-containing protein [Nocardioides zeae]MDT9594569.1 DUF4192 domain-containing protein [Nocardioides zeae]
MDTRDASGAPEPTPEPTPTPTLEPTPAPGAVPAPEEPVRLRLSTPEDLLAAVPVLLGFEPADSLVLLTFTAPGAPRGPQLRVDLPDAGDAVALDELVDLVLAPCVRHRVERVAMVLYTVAERAAATVADALVPALLDVGVDVVTVVAADGRTWWRVDDPAGALGMPAVRTAYRVDAHPIRADAVVRGQVVHASRAELAATLAPHETRQTRVTRAARDERRRDRARTSAAETAWVAGTVSDLVRRRLAPPTGASDRRTTVDLDPATAARLLLALEVGVNRDAAWRGLDRATAQAHHDLWTDLLRCAPAGLRAAPAALVALTSWLLGNGALAWCGVDACLEEAPQHGLGCLVRDLLVAATPPTWWEEVATLVHGDPA